MSRSVKPDYEKLKNPGNTRNPGNDLEAWGEYWAEKQERNPLIIVPEYPCCATCDGGGCGDCI